MGAEDDKAAALAAAKPAGGLAGVELAVDQLGPPVSPFTTTAHRLASETADETAASLRDAGPDTTEETTRAE